MRKQNVENGMENLLEQTKKCGCEPLTLMVQAIQALKREKELRQKAEAELEARKSNVPFNDVVFGCEKSITVKEMANLLFQSGVDIGEARLYQWLRGNGYVYRQASGHNLPSQKSLEMGVMELRKQMYMNMDGRKSFGKTLVVTPKGQEYFMLLLGNSEESCPKTNKKHKSA